MGCIDQRVYALGSEVMRKSLRAAEAADPYRDRLRRGRCGTARKRKGRVDADRQAGPRGAVLPQCRRVSGIPHGRS